MPILLEIEDEGAVDMCNNWIIILSISVKQDFACELKEEGLK